MGTYLTPNNENSFSDSIKNGSKNINNNNNYNNYNNNNSIVVSSNRTVDCQYENHRYIYCQNPVDGCHKVIAVFLCCSYL